ncbi:ATPase [Haematobacter missouriensis]|uniref:histidine kinase n=1 Tax=Haematobacter missouriensis TaxID=366616 RepID=A0A212AQ40_9RHOB|nr:hybrid sensor histidine kinase/response regulator [Haematobacter missouriensis]KFI27809.1 ATPase [Haematobacter missouriensis]OWJ75991.1 hybrid sensor histidine kinase/response regulator [Haematobacter missouriensis]OWJ83436.1 hybrid sensor histidine kinase/response regulator [Haematobacter missouriensis]
MFRESDGPQRRIDKLEQINAALMQRLQRMEETRGSSYALTRTAAMLEREVLARNRELERALSELSEANAELARAREAADQASRAKSRFLRAASHDLLQPLSAAKLFLTHLAETSREPLQAELVERITASFDSAEELIRTLLDIAKLDSDRSEVSISPVSIGRLFQRIGIDLQPLAAGRQVSLQFVPTAQTVLSDPVLLRSIGQNLVSNALKYTTGDKVLVGARRDGDGIWLEVLDQGPGIAPSDQSRIFNEFERLSRSDQPGSGLGLSIVQRACQRLGHPLELISAPGKGSRFRVRLPRLGEMCLLPPQRVGAVDDPGALLEFLAGHRILIVENDPSVRSAFAFLLRSWGVDVTTAAGLEDALATLAQAIPDAILSDYRLDNGETGCDVIAALRERADKPLPALMVSAEQLEFISEAASRIGAEVLAKPLAEMDLRRSLARLLGGPVA